MRMTSGRTAHSLHFVGERMYDRKTGELYVVIDRNQSYLQWRTSRTAFVVTLVSQFMEQCLYLAATSTNDHSCSYEPATALSPSFLPSFHTMSLSTSKTPSSLSYSLLTLKGNQQPTLRNEFLNVGCDFLPSHLINRKQDPDNNIT